MSINGISRSNSYQNIASGRRINKAADDPAGLKISEKLSSRTRGIEKGTNNGSDFKNLLRTADGGAANISEQLIRMKELSVQASNGILTNEDKKTLQNEINEIKKGINDVIKSTKYNSKSLIDGSFKNKSVVTNPDGKGTKLSLNAIDTKSLNLDDFDITKDFDISIIDKAIEKVSNVRSYIGVSSNNLDSKISYNSVAKENLIAANSKISDSDFAKEIMNLNKNKVIEQFKINMQKNENDNKKQGLNLLL